MNVIKKIFCFLSVLVLSVPVLCFNVSAFDISGRDLYPTTQYVESCDFSSNKVSTMIENILSRYTLTNTVTDSMQTYPNYICYYNGKYFEYDISDLSQLVDAQLLSILSSLDSNVSFYSYSFVALYESSSRIDTFYSLSPIYITYDSGVYRSVSETGIAFKSSNIAKKSNGLLNEYLSSNSSYKDSCYFSYSSDCASYLTPSFFGGSNNFTADYLVCDYDDTSFFDFLVGATLDGITTYHSNYDDLAYSVDVKLTPVFQYDMNRFDPTTNQSDYFKLEITNNSSSAIQWCAGIYGNGLPDTGNYLDNSFTSWAYLCNSTYYDIECVEDKGLFRNTYTYSGVLRKGASDIHYLGSGETFSDVIYWENVNIQANTEYHFFVSAVVTSLKYATTNFDPVFTEDTSDGVSKTILEDSYYDTILENATGFRKIESVIYNVAFSCLTMPEFTTTVRGGNCLLNSSANDRYQQKKNFESFSDFDGTNVSVNKNYTDPSVLAKTFNRSDVNVDIDNISTADVNDYISYSQDFFNLLKSVFATFPAYIWALICFGLTGLIVIAIVKALL